MRPVTGSAACGQLVSVIVPVYNAEKFLARCIESVLGQTHTEIELILVDDGSRDGSPAICDEYASRDARVRVIHKANGGVSAARNDGIEASRGEWLAFCDNDDFYAPGMVARLVEMCTANDCDIAQCRSARGEAESLPTPPPQPVKVLGAREMLEDFYREATIYVWDKLYRREVWREVRFPVGSYTGEDLMVVHRLIGAARKIALTHERLYYHYRNPESVMGHGFDVRWATGALADRVEFARSHDLPRLMADTMARRVYEERYLVAMNRRYNTDGVSRREFAATHRALLHRYYREAMRAKGLPAKERLFITLCRYAPLLFNLYNWLKFRVLRGDATVRFGEVK
jgi:glycosyltransferase involved in cell wall biosynthesis